MVYSLFKPGEDILSSLTDLDCRLIHAILGITGEAGELLDVIKRAVIYRKEIDVQHAIEELGDIEFYLEALRQDLHITRQKCLDANIDKLGIRYPNWKYTDTSAKARADKEVG